jgi:hypothetical protein
LATRSLAQATITAAAAAAAAVGALVLLIVVGIAARKDIRQQILVV